LSDFPAKISVIIANSLLLQKFLIVELFKICHCAADKKNLGYWEEFLVVDRIM
jgi:hypothetical protein